MFGSTVDILRQALGIEADADLGPSLRDLIWPGRHTALLQQRRSELIISRVRLMAGLFAILTPLWIIVDALLFSDQVWPLLALARLAATVAFIVLVRSYRQRSGMARAYKALTFMFAVPTVFYAVVYPWLAGQGIEAWAGAGVMVYAFMPFIVLVGLGVIPITVIEGVLFALPLLAVGFAVHASVTASADWQLAAGAMWLQIPLAGGAVLAGLSQLHLMNRLVGQSNRDSLTGAYVRTVGEDLLEVLQRNAERRRGPLSLALIGLDDYAGPNTRQGRAAADGQLAELAQAVGRVVRQSDVVVRWGNDELLVLFTETAAEGAEFIASRLAGGSAVKFSLGIADWWSDGTAGWQGTVEVAAERRHQARQAAKAGPGAGAEAGDGNG
ncbi:MAG: GGDEF domain-containing protein [Alphaproteobacteria bacterium]|jgi:GGDEF domain-containing protein|nr:GGDEF domain-containing protein [Alphaproteobacteria bacterium]HJP22063.1 GGDEF domain-containing protein [Alphaproteobacteria bacterium]